MSDDDEKKVVAVSKEMSPEDIENLEELLKENLENLGVPGEMYDNLQVVTSSDIDDAVWGNDGSWYFHGKIGIYGPFETRGQAIDALIECRKTEER